jgi:hypothetical protein
MQTLREPPLAPSMRLEFGLGAASIRIKVAWNLGGKLCRWSD